MVVLPSGMAPDPHCRDGARARHTLAGKRGFRSPVAAEGFAPDGRFPTEHALVYGLAIVILMLVPRAPAATVGRITVHW